MTFDYFYSDLRSRENFIMMPKELFSDERFSSLSIQAKSLYCMMLDRMSLSAKNGLKDEQNRIYIIFTLKEAMELLGVGKTKCIRIFAELDEETGTGLIERVKRGQGKAAYIYVKNAFPPESNLNSEEGLNKDLQKSQKRTSRGLKNEPLEVSKSDHNNTDINKTEENKTDFSNYHINSYLSNTLSNLKKADETIRREKMSLIIKNNIEFDILKERYSEDKLTKIVDIMTDCVTNENDFLIIGGKKIPSSLVKQRMLSLDSSHIEYVLDCMAKNKTLIRNIKSYLISALYNAYQTIDFYYEMMVRYDLSEENNL